MLWTRRFEMLRRAHDPEGDGGETETAEDDRDVQEGPWFACAACRARIAPRSAIFVMNGQTDHVRHNPHGLVFHIRCLRTARGARAVGAPTTDHTWFAGYGWRIALCGGCGVHLGWGFSGGGSPARFWGLIAERLVEIDARE